MEHLLNPASSSTIATTIVTALRGIATVFSQSPLIAAGCSSLTVWAFLHYLPLSRSPGTIYAAPPPKADPESPWKSWIIDQICGQLREYRKRETYAGAIEWTKITGGKPFTHRTIFVWMVGVPDQADIEHILVHNQRNYQKNIGYKVLENVIGIGLVSIRDENEHTVQRREVSPAFSPAVLKDIANYTVREHSVNLVEQLKEVAQQTNPVTTVRELMNRTTMNVITQAAFHSDGEMTEKLAQDFHLVIENATGLGRFIPAFNALFYKKNRIVAAARRRLYASTKTIADSVRDQKKQKMKGGASDTEPNHKKALIDFLVESSKFSEQQLMDHGMTFLFAGFETTSTTMQWAMYLLAKNPSAQEELCEELSSVVGKDTFCEVDDLKGCSVLLGCMKEALRLYPAAAAVARTSVEDDVLPSGTFIPKGTFVVPNFFLLHRDPKIWGEDAAEFRPSRWWEGTSDEKRGAMEKAWMPFSIGKRNCIGKDFAMNELSLLMGAVFRNFRISLPEGEKDPQRTFTFTLQAKVPVRFVVEKRSE